MNYTCFYLFFLNSNQQLQCILHVPIEMLTVGIPYPMRPRDFLNETVDDCLAQGTSESIQHLLNICLYSYFKQSSNW